MNENTNRLKLPLLVPNQSGKEFTHNEALIIIDNLLQNHIISKNLNIPPIEPNTADMYIVANNGINEWKNKDNQLAFYDNGWRFIKPNNGMLLYVLEENCFYVYKNKWEKLENLVDFNKLKNIEINNLQENEIIKYNGNNFVNTRELDLLKLYINNKLLIDENLNISVKNDDGLINIISITTNEINFKNNIKIAGVIIDDYITNVISSKINDNVIDIGISSIQNYCMPDYNKTIKNVGNNYTAPLNGYFLFNIENQDSHFKLFINNVEYLTMYNAYGIRSGYNILLNKGDSVNITNAVTVHSYFIPLKNITNDDNDQGE